MTLTDPFAQQMDRLDSLIQEAETISDPAARVQLQEIVRTLLELHGSGLAAMVQRIARAGDPGRAILADLAADQGVASLLLLHNLHPDSLEARVRQALEDVKPALAGHGGGVELLSITPDGEVRLRLEGNCHGCSSSRVTLRSTIEDAIYAAAPDVTALHVEGVEDESNPATHDPPVGVGVPEAKGFVALSVSVQGHKPAVN